MAASAQVRLARVVAGFKPASYHTVMPQVEIVYQQPLVVGVLAPVLLMV